jgi:hypothetical protein
MGGPEDLRQRQVAEYVDDLTTVLARMTKAADCDTLTYLLEVTSLEARRIARSSASRETATDESPSASLAVARPGCVRSVAQG